MCIAIKGIIKKCNGDATANWLLKFYLRFFVSSLSVFHLQSFISNSHLQNGIDELLKPIIQKVLSGDGKLFFNKLAFGLAECQQGGNA